MKKNSKGFTLTELVISLTISLLVMGIITSMIAITKSDMVITTTSAGRINEFYKIEKFVNNYLSTFSNEDYVLLTPEEINADHNNATHEISFALKPESTNNQTVNNGQPLLVYSLIYDTLLDQIICEKPSGTEIISVSMISNANFSRQGNLIKLTLTYEETNTYTILFNYFL